MRREMKRMQAGEEDERRKLYRAVQKYLQLLGGSVKNMLPFERQKRIPIFGGVFEKEKNA